MNNHVISISKLPQREDSHCFVPV